MEILRQTRKRFGKVGIHYPREVRISRVCGSEFSEAGEVFKAVCVYESDLGRRTVTRRFSSIKSARHWGRQALAQ